MSAPRSLALAALLAAASVAGCRCGGDAGPSGATVATRSPDPVDPPAAPGATGPAAADGGPDAPAAEPSAPVAAEVGSGAAPAAPFGAGSEGWPLDAALLDSVLGTPSVEGDIGAAGVEAAADITPTNAKQLADQLEADIKAELGRK